MKLLLVALCGVCAIRVNGFAPIAPPTAVSSAAAPLRASPIDDIDTDAHLDLIEMSQMGGGGAVGGLSMLAGGAGASTYEGARIGPPPDLPSLLLHNRIVYLGMPLVPAVTELIVAELLYLNYESSSKVMMYVNTPGTSTPDGRSLGFETEAFAIADCMKYVKPPVYTVGVGQAFGLGAMLLASGDKGNRAALPNASIMLHQPRSQARGQASDIAIKAKEVLANRKIATDMLAKACGKTFDEVERDSSRTFYMSPDEAVDYGLIDKVFKNSKKDNAPKPSFLDSINMN
ncbi:unnamed protein product [Chrysoparadoxa australica]